MITAVAKASGSTQTAPFDAKGVDMSDKSAVEDSDKKRFEFVKYIVDKVENKKISSSSQTKQDAVDRIVANKWLGILIFAAVMWAVFAISQTYVGPWFADIFVGWIDSFMVLLKV